MALRGWPACWAGASQGLPWPSAAAAAPEVAPCCSARYSSAATSGVMVWSVRSAGRNGRNFSAYVPGLDYQELIARYLLKASMHMLRAASGTDQWRKFEKGRR